MVVVDEDTKHVQKQTVVSEVEKAVYDALDSEDDTPSLTDLIGQIEEHAVVVDDEDMKQEVVPEVEMLQLSYGQIGGQEGQREPSDLQVWGEGWS